MKFEYEFRIFRLIITAHTAASFALSYMELKKKKADMTGGEPGGG